MSTEPEKKLPEKAETAPEASKAKGKKNKKEKEKKTPKQEIMSWITTLLAAHPRGWRKHARYPAGQGNRAGDKA